MKVIKRRIKSVESTMQITKAMELVASSKLRKAKEKADKARPYFNALYDTMCEIEAENPKFLSLSVSFCTPISCRYIHQSICCLYVLCHHLPLR